MIKDYYSFCEQCDKNECTPCCQSRVLMHSLIAVLFFKEYTVNCPRPSLHNVTFTEACINKEFRKCKKAGIFCDYAGKTELTFVQTYATCSTHGRSTERTSFYCVTRNILMNAAQWRCERSSKFHLTFLIEYKFSYICSQLFNVNVRKLFKRL